MRQTKQEASSGSAGRGKKRLLIAALLLGGLALLAGGFLAGRAFGGRKDPNKGTGRDTGRTAVDETAQNGERPDGPQEGGIVSEELAFYARFYELDRERTETWLDAHPDVRAGGYASIEVDESAIGGEGTSILTKQGEKVLALDAKNGILLLEVDADGSRGLLAIVKEPAALHLFPAERIGTYGETVASIAERNGGILAVTASGIPADDLSGGEPLGHCICGGKSYGVRGTNEYGWSRLELLTDDTVRIVPAATNVGADVTDAMESGPALIMDGKTTSESLLDSLNSRACIGRTERGDVLLLVVEGRLPDSLGCSLDTCTELLRGHGAVDAINCGGGSAPILWYKGKTVTRFSNPGLPDGIRLPNAWVVLPAE